MVAQKLKTFLDQNQIHYEVVPHSPAYTAQEIAATAHLSGKMIAKTVIVKLDDRMAMVVLPAHRYVSLDYLREITGCDNVQFARESEFKALFLDCEIGAMPPLGNLYGMDVYVAQELTEDEEIAFNACTHTELIRMSYQDFERLVHPMVASLTV